MRAVVIGAGMIGASVALRLAQAGAEVIVLEAGRVAAGTSMTSFAWVSACEKVGSDAYYRLSLAGVQAHVETVKEFGAEARWYPRPGVIQWDLAEFEDPAAEASAADRKFELLTALGYPAELIDAAALERLEPSLAANALGGKSAIHYPTDGYIQAPLYIGAMLERAVRIHGAEVRQFAPVVAVLRQGDTAHGVRLASGEEIHADAVINCAGHRANEVLADETLRVPLAPTLGLIAYTAPVASSLRKVLRTPKLNLRPDGGGRVLLRANDLDRRLTADDLARPDHPVALELQARLGDLVPSLKDTPIEAARIATRPIPQDGLPCVGPIPGVFGYFVAVTHGGVNTGAFIGFALRDEILGGRAAPEYAPYQPARFFKALA